MYNLEITTICPDFSFDKIYALFGVNFFTWNHVFVKLWTLRRSGQNQSNPGLSKLTYSLSRSHGWPIMRLCKTKPPCESHSNELIFAQLFGKIFALYLISGLIQETQLKGSLNYVGAYNFIFCKFQTNKVDFGLSSWIPKKWISNSVNNF